MIYGYAKEQDIPKIKALWERVFADPPEYIDLFLDEFFCEHSAILANDGEKLAAMANIFSAGKLIAARRDTAGEGTGHNPENSPECFMVYAVATDPAYRRRGIAKEILKTLTKEYTSEGRCCVISPASDYLFGYYERHLGFSDAFFVREAVCDAPEDMALPGIQNIRPAGASEYNRFRDDFLSGHTFLSFSDKVISFQKTVCQMSGGDLYFLGMPGGDVFAAAAIEQSGSSAYVRELLCGEEHAEYVLKCIGSIIPPQIKKLYVRMPAWLGCSLAGGVRRIGQIIMHGTPHPPYNMQTGYTGFVFD